MQGLEEWDQDPGTLRPVPMVALNDHQVALIYSLVLLALVQKTESNVDRPHERGDGLTHVVLRAGDHVRHIDERFADDYSLVAVTGPG